MSRTTIWLIAAVVMSMLSGVVNIKQAREIQILQIQSAGLSERLAQHQSMLGELADATLEARKDIAYLQDNALPEVVWSGFALKSELDKVDARERQHWLTANRWAR